MLECSRCGFHAAYNPIDPESDEYDDELQVRTPISGCQGFVSFVGDSEETFYGCGESGAVWKQKENLYRDIEYIIDRYPHRKHCYVFIDGEWTSNPDEPENIEELISLEEAENVSQFNQD